MSLHSTAVLRVCRENFLEMHSLVKEAAHRDIISTDSAASITGAVQFAQLYFKRQFQCGLARAAVCALHCFDCVLDPASSCSHQEAPCFGCTKAFSACVAMRTLAEQCRSAPEEPGATQHEDMATRAEVCAENILKYVGHLVRERWARDVRAKRSLSLLPHQAFITIDWAMKFNPVKAKETSPDWFGKHGISFHSAAIVTKDPDERPYVRARLVEQETVLTQDAGTLKQTSSSWTLSARRAVRTGGW